MHHTHTLRVRYCDVDAMGTYYNSRALEWFECGRTELCRSTGVPYTEWEKRGVMLPVTESHVEYLGKAVYDDLLRVTTASVMTGRARVRFDVRIDNADTARAVCRGYTVHAITDARGKPIRPPAWVVDLLKST